MHPWQTIPLADYEEHMSHRSVGQLPLLNIIVKDQVLRYRPAHLVYLGIGAGNGLEHCDASVTRVVTGIDINAEYLQECRRRFPHSPFDLRLITADLSSQHVAMEQADLFIANLFLEYVPLEQVLTLIGEVGTAHAVLSIVVQQNNGADFVSPTGVHSVRAAAGCHTDQSETGIIGTLQQHRFSIIQHVRYPLPGNKEFIRIDARRESE